MQDDSSAADAQSIPNSNQLVLMGSTQFSQPIQDDHQSKRQRTDAQHQNQQLTQYTNTQSSTGYQVHMDIGTSSQLPAQHGTEISVTIRNDMNTMMDNKLKEYKRYRNTLRRKCINLTKMESYKQRDVFPRDLDFTYNAWRTIPKTVDNSEEVITAEEFIILTAKQDILSRRIECLREDVNQYSCNKKLFTKEQLLHEFKEKHSDTLSLTCSKQVIDNYCNNSMIVYQQKFDDAEAQIDADFQSRDEKYQQRLLKKLAKEQASTTPATTTDNNTDNNGSKHVEDLTDDDIPLTKTSVAALIKKEVSEALNSIKAELVNLRNTLNPKKKNNNKKSSKSAKVKNVNAPTKQSDRPRLWSDVLKNGDKNSKQKQSTPAKSTPQRSNQPHQSNQTKSSKNQSNTNNSNQPPPKPPYQHRTVHLKDVDESDQGDWKKVQGKQKKGKQSNPKSSSHVQEKGNGKQSQKRR